MDRRKYGRCTNISINHVCYKYIVKYFGFYKLNLHGVIWCKYVFNHKKYGMLIMIELVINRKGEFR